jgi:antitoxin MazE
MAGVKVELVKWGNSHAVRIPKVVLDRVDIREGDELEVRVENGGIALQPVAPKLRLRDLVKRIKPANLHGELAWGKPKGREVW